jgi:hypothetical protein
MDIEEIGSMWYEDTYIKQEKLHEESLKIPMLHHKYLMLYMEEKTRLNKLTVDLDKFESMLEEYILNSLSPEDHDKFEELAKKKNIVLPDPNKKVLRTDIKKKVESNSYVIQQKLKMVECQDKIEMLKMILDQIKNRSFQIRDAISFIQFQAGGR